MPVAYSYTFKTLPDRPLATPGKFLFISYF
jgi:hypothetical protein